MNGQAVTQGQAIIWGGGLAVLLALIIMGLVLIAVFGFRRDGADARAAQISDVRAPAADDLMPETAGLAPQADLPATAV